MEKITMRIRSIAVAASLALACGSSTTAAPDDASATSSGDAGTDGTTSVSGDVQPLQIAFTFHLEGPSLVASKEAFDRYVGEIKTVADNFHRNGAIATWEAAEIVDKSITYNSKVLKELQDGGDAIGLHANGAGYVPTDPNYSVEKMTKELTRERDALKSLGINVRHVSNICSTIDWVKAVQASGFEAVTGVVEFCLKSLSSPPSEVASCDAPNLCHGQYPKATEDAMTPWYASDGATWTTPASTGLLILPTRGAMPCSAEEAGGAVSPTHCKYGDDDATALLAQLDVAVAARKPGKVHTFVLVASFGQTPDAGILENFLKSIKTKYIDTGKGKWAGVPAMIDAVKGAQ
jgi:hypothetical protein